MDFDEYEYLEKTVEDPESRNGSSGKRDRDEKSRRSSRTKVDEDEEKSDQIAEIKGKKSRGEVQNGERRDSDDRARSSRGDKHDKDRHRSSRDAERDRDRGDRGGRVDREKEKEKEKEKLEVREREKERLKERYKEKEREREKEVEKDKEREREREKEKEKERERERSRRSSSRSRRHRSDHEKDADVEMLRGRSKDRDARGREPGIELREPEREGRSKDFKPHWEEHLYYFGGQKDIKVVGYKFKALQGSKLHISTPTFELRSTRFQGSKFQASLHISTPTFKLYKVPSSASPKEFNPLSLQLAMTAYRSTIHLFLRCASLNLQSSHLRFLNKKDMVEPEADPERDQRTVFAYQMPLKAAERDVYEFFSKAGKVRDVRLIMDRNSRRSKGVGYIEFYDAMSVPMAIALSGQLLFGQPVMVKPSEAEKNLVQSTATGVGSVGLVGPYGAVARKLYVGNLHFNMTEDQLRQVFEPFGPVEIVQLPLDLETGQCKGFGFVQFAQLEHSKAAQSLNGKLEIAGRVIKVSAVTDHIGAQNAGANAADFDDDDGGGFLSLNAQSRAMLMQKLDRTGVATSIAGSLGVPLPINGQAAVSAPVLPALVLSSPVTEPVGTPSVCLLLKNMFDPTTETEPDYDVDIKEDVYEECSNFGFVKHIYVDKNSAGYVYLRFEAVEAAVSAQKAMHMRWNPMNTKASLEAAVDEWLI
ncbi:hypothetical protein GIB67_043256 [Kingdonia uniflora]|uniref:RRM domain-containing protein n=1 Tax=Kingdonia uniflora TaxID=39325 RepID=A0A7J7NKA6_9MAGN|nr:hypothetical protein GIB67_043256 [Kingdonia uniflora]